jgi:hypothetical protein
MGRLAPDGLLGVHFNFLSAAPRELLMAALNLRLAFPGRTASSSVSSPRS